MSEDYDKVYEVDKEIKVNSVMQLIDINGSKVNFQSDCLVNSSVPTSKILVAIVNQDELDNGNIKFELIEETGKYARRVSFQENVKKNHFICIKKHPSEPLEEIDCTVLIRMKELPPPKVQPPTPPPKPVVKQPPRPTNKNQAPNLDTVKNENMELKKQLEELRKKQEYKNKRDHIEDIHTNMNSNNIHNNHNNHNIHNNQDLDMPIYTENESSSYYKISMVCLVLFTLIVFYKFVRK